MDTRILYIIGNGFDLQHGLKTRYWDFKEYLDDVDSDLVEKLEEYFGSDALWSDFEETLAYLDTEQIVDECLNYLVSYGDEDWSDAYHHDYQYEVQRRIDLITKTLKQKFTEWILQISIPETASKNKVIINKNALFITFNYTDTLEILYKVSADNILYIHNKAIDKNSTLILGHSRNPKSTKTLSELYNDENSDVRVAEGNQILDNYFLETFKTTETIIRDNNKFFDSLEHLEFIYVYGHSLSVVDKPYFQRIVKTIDKSKVKWKVSFHNKKDLFYFNAFFKDLGISSDLIIYDRMNNIDSSQLTIFPNENPIKL
jgi:hypothetical protein